MWAINLKIFGVVIGTLALYTMLANSIPQVQSEVPRAIALGPDVSPEELARVGEQVYGGAGGCTACHGSGTRAPNLLTDERGTGSIGARCGNRVPGKSCKDYLHEALVQPAAYVAPGYDPIMPDVSRQLPSEQVWALVAYLQSVGGTVDVTAEDLAASGEGDGAASSDGGAGAAGEGGGGGGFLAGGSTDAREILNAGGCLGCHALGDEGGALGPAFTGIGARLTSAKIREAILDPAADIPSGYEHLAAVMPKNFGEQLSAGQLESLVRFLAGQR